MQETASGTARRHGKSLSADGPCGHWPASWIASFIERNLASFRGTSRTPSQMRDHVTSSHIDVNTTSLAT